MGDGNGRILTPAKVTGVVATGSVITHPTALVLAALGRLDARAWPSGMSPRSVWPIGYSRHDARRWLFQVAPGLSFRITATPPNFRDVSYAIAEHIEQEQWISYFHCKKSGRRKLFLVHAKSTANADALRRYLGIPARVARSARG